MTEEIIALNSNSAQPGINQKGVSNLSVLLPDAYLIKIFDQLIYSITIKIFENCKISLLLENIRDILLPQLISGKIRVQKPKIY